MKIVNNKIDFGDEATAVINCIVESGLPASEISQMDIIESYCFNVELSDFSDYLLAMVIQTLANMKASQ